jgi:IPT/TIG domain-containing protein
VATAVDNEHVTIAWGIAYVLAAATLLIASRLKKPIADLSAGQDRRASTSKFQVVAWTYVVVFALLVFLFAYVVDQVWAEFGGNAAKDVHAALGTGVKNLVTKLDETYLVLLGVPLTAAVGAKAITSTKVESGTVEKTEKADGTPTVAELVNDDEGNTDLGDFQYVLFNVVAILFFLAQFLPHPAHGLPDMPDTLVGLTSVAAAGYVAKKGVYRDPPILYSVLPPAAAPGDIVSVYGSSLGSGGAGASPQVLFGVVPADLVTPEGADGKQLRATVPRRSSAGPVQVRVVRPPGAESGTLPFEVLSATPKIESVNPPPRLGVASSLTISGFGFLVGAGGQTASNAVTLEGRPLTITSITDTQVVVDFPADAATLGITAGEHEVLVYDAAGRPSAPAKVTVLAAATP